MTDQAIFIPGAQPPALTKPALWFVIQGDRLVVLSSGAADRRIPQATDLSALGLTPIRTQFIGMWGETACFSAEIPPDAALEEGRQAFSLRRVYDWLDAPLFWVAARALQIVDWDRTHLFCGRCGSATQRKPDEHVKVCPNCGQTSYPRLAPAVIVAVEKGDRLLLAHNRRHPAGFYSVLAGFVEPGETLEQTVAREVREEVGIAVKNIRYFGSQPWPFPHSLMLAFTADYAGGELRFEDEEIESAEWFSADHLPPVPPPLSIARTLIDAFVARHLPPPEM